MKTMLLISLLFFGVAALAAIDPVTPKGYRIHTIETPNKIPFHATGLDVDKVGRIYVATRLGDVWVYQDAKWSQFADGLHEPTGLMIDKDGTVMVAQKPEVTRLVDIDGNGVADDYIKVAAGWDFHNNYHEFNFGPVRDKKGNYYGTLNLGHGVKDALSFGVMDSGGGYRGWAYKVTPKGKFVPFANGLRSPAGVGMSPKNELFVTDNQGDWVATSKLHLIRQGEFYGHPVSLRDAEGYTIEQLKKITPKELKPKFVEPNVWFPHGEISSSPGNPEWDLTKGKFGPFKGQMFIGDQTLSNVFRVVLEKVKGNYQGAAINFLTGFQSGNIRLKFDATGQLWVGQTSRGWGSEGKKPYGVQKVTWDGQMPFELLDISMIKGGFKLRFTEALDLAAIKKKAITVKSWRYHYHAKYGSPKVDLRNETVNSIHAKGKKAVQIKLKLEAGRVYAVSFGKLMNKAGEKVTAKTAYYTANAVR